MDGSPLLFILMIFVITPLLGGWLAVVYYVSSHPAHKTPRAASEIASRNSPKVPLPRSAPAEPAPQKGAVPVLLPELAYSRQSLETAADPGRASSLHGGVQRPAA
jgi:hypothetical protein